MVLRDPQCIQVTQTMNLTLLFSWASVWTLKRETPGGSQYAFQPAKVTWQKFKKMAKWVK